MRQKINKDVIKDRLTFGPRYRLVLSLTLGLDTVLLVATHTYLSFPYETNRYSLGSSPVESWYDHHPCHASIRGRATEQSDKQSCGYGHQHLKRHKSVDN